MPRLAARDDATAILVSLRQLVRFLRVSDREAEQACGVSGAQLFVLRQLAGAPAASLAELAARTLTDQSSVSTVVARLVAHGFVRRTPSTRDRRRAELCLTPAGRRLLLRAPRTPQADLIAAVSAMPPARRAQIARALATLTAAMGADALAPRMFFEAD